MDLTLRLHPDPALRMACGPARDDPTALARAMLDVMYAAPGRGLAAPQVGLAERLFVMDASWKEGLPDPRVFVNPVLTWMSEDGTVGEEQCLSIPGRPVAVRRAAAVELTFDGGGGRRVERFTGFAAACVQHEVDHLDGVLILDRAADRAAP